MEGIRSAALGENPLGFLHKAHFPSICTKTALFLLEFQNLKATLPLDSILHEDMSNFVQMVPSWCSQPKE